MSDEVLVAKYVEGQNEAFDVLVDRYKDRVFAQIMKTVKDPDVADDIFQETFVKVITTINQGRYNEAFATSTRPRSSTVTSCATTTSRRASSTPRFTTMCAA